MTPSDAPDLVLVERPEPGLAIVTLNRPQALNALSSALRRQLRRAIDTLNADGQARVLILRGAGRAFCAGLDLKELQQRTQSAAAPAADAGGSPAFLGDAPNVAGSIVGFDGPLIGLVQGAAITGGFELALLCDVLLAAPDARFADTHGRVGILPGSGMSQRLSRRIGIARAKEVSLTGNFIDALTAERWGLVNRVVPHDELLAQGLQLARDMLELPDAMLRGYRQLIDDGFAGSQTAGLALEQARARAWHSAHADGVLAGGGMAALQQRARHTP
ncbi:enoyl-CoA hydratase [Comamonas serinivorans]|nr:enoyl-CoA hydratase [Comamonas serinivorans]